MHYEDVLVVGVDDQSFSLQRYFQFHSGPLEERITFLND
jgi:hypothetical protein